MPALAEDLLLLVLDAESGRPVVGRTELDRGVAGALLLDLVRTARVTVGPEGGKSAALRVLDRTPSGDPVLDRALARLGDKQVRARRAVDRLAKGSRRAVLERLTEQGTLRRTDARVLGILPRTRWVPGDGDERRAARLRSSCASVLTGQVEPDEHLGNLIALLHAMDAVHRVVRGNKRELRARAREIAEGNAGGDAVRTAIRAVRAAMMAAVVAGATSGSTNSS